MYYLKKSKSGKKKREGLSAQIRKLDRVFSLYIRLRDSRPFGYRQFRCISCGMIKPFDQMDCGHFIGRTHMATRFDEENCNGECKGCNRFSPDHIIFYQKNLTTKIGKEKVEALIAKGKQTKKWSAYELDILIKYYTARVQEMEQEKQ